MKKCFTVLLSLTLACALCLSLAEADGAALYAQGDAAFLVQDYEKALEYWSAAAETGNADALHNLGWMYEHGVGVEPDYEKAWDYYAKAAELGNELSYYGLGLMSFDGKGVEQSYEKAADYFLKAVELGETQKAQAYFDQLVEEGKIPADYTPNEI